MGYTNVGLKDKIMEMYPEVAEQGIMVSLDFDTAKNAYTVKFSKGSHEMTTNLDKKDADDCMDGTKCIYLGVQIGEFINNFRRD